VAAAQVVAAERGGVAFVCAEPGRLPDAQVVTLEAFPTTESPNGIKIRRARLREMAERILREPAE
jgi:hypothetical protein